MNDEHITAFVSECRESITDLNNALLSLEDDPSDEEAIESVFRTAHTLKGNFGAMGFSTASELAHVLEDLLDEIRDGRIEVTADVMDDAFVAIDDIEKIVNEIDSEGEVNTKPTQTIERIEKTIESELNSDTDTNPTEDETNTSTEDNENENDLSDIEFEVAEETPEEIYGDDEITHIAVTVDDGGILGVDGLLIVEEIEEEFDNAHFVPSVESIEDGEYDGSFDCFITDVDIEDIDSIFSSINKIKSYTISELNTKDTGGESDGGDETVTDVEENEVGEISSSTTESESTNEKDTSSASTSSGSSGNISSVRVDVNRLDELHNLVEQLVTGRITIRRAIENDDLDTAKNSLSDFDKVTSRLQNTVMDMRLIPLKRVVSNLPRVVRDVARSEGKEVSFEMVGQDIELDRSILSEIEDPLIHVLRNSVDHGIEDPDTRENIGKSREGTVRLEATRKRDHVTIVVEDDGGGIDADEMKKRAVDEDVITQKEADEMSDGDAYDLIFHPGFSTAEEVTDVSGRGVGMDVVYSTVEQLDGTVNVDSTKGEGTTVTIELPVSVAIVNTLFITVGGNEYGIPIKNIDELTRVSSIETVNGDEVVRHDGDVYPVIDLQNALQVDDGHENEDSKGEDMLVRVRGSVREIALRCESFSDQEEVVVKPLEGELSGISGLSGTAILGDGNVVPILDVDSLGE